MRRAANIDKCQPEIVAKLRKCGVSVECLHQTGKGVPDLLCGYRGVNVLIELKDPAADHNPAQSGLNLVQQEWHAKWSGQVATARTFQQAMDAVIEASKTKSLLEREHERIALIQQLDRPGNERFDE